jgi:ornithine--oxo-acid transaminase
MPSTADVIEMTNMFGAHNYLPLPVCIDVAEGVWVTDPESNRYMDMLSAYSALNQGYNHPRIMKVAIAQLKKGVPLTSRAFHNTELGPFCQELAELTGQEKVLPMNSGAEAVETALKVARKWGHQVKGIPDGQAEIIVCEGNFHGRTISIISFSSEEAYREGFGPFTPGFKIISYGDAQALEDAITDNTCAFLFEPIQGEAGVNVPPEGYLKQVREICTKHNVLMMADEIQTGFGRTGRRFCCDHEYVVPDVYIVGKALSGGFLPVSAIATSREVMNVFRPGDHGSTFGGAPLGMAVAREALKVIEDEKLSQRSDELGAYFRQQLAAMNSPHIREIRGKGLLIGVELTDEAGKARPFCYKLMKLGLLCKETHDNVIRFAPPLIITREEIDWAMERIQQVLS